MQNQDRLNKYFYGTLLVAVAVFLYSLVGRMIHIDDAWLGEYSYWWSELGYVKSNAMRGFYNAEDKLFIYHKLFAPQGALLIKLFGFNAYVLKSLSLIYLFLCFWISLKIYRNYSSWKTGGLLLVSLMLSFHQMVSLGFIFRPEISLIFYGLLSFYFLDRSFHTTKWTTLIFSALLAGVCAATHLNGTIYIGAGVLLLWMYKRWLHGLIYGIVGSWGVWYYLIDVRSFQELQMLAIQFRNWRDVKDGESGLIALLFRVLSEQKRFMHTPPEIIYTVLLLVFVFGARKFLAKTAPRILSYSLILTLLLALVAHGKTTKYIVFAFPFFGILITLAFESLFNENKKMRGAWIALGAFFVVNWGYNISYFRTRESGRERFAKIAEATPSNANIMGPYTYVFAAIQRHQNFQSSVIYEDALRSGELDPSEKSLFERLNSYGIDYVILGSELREKFNVTGDGNQAYQKVDALSDTELDVYERKK